VRELSNGLAALDALQVEEKAATRARNALAAKRRRLPMMEVTKSYEFEGPEGKVGLLDLFAGRGQLLLYHFMFAPGVNGWPDAGCPGCSMAADGIGHLAHFHARDTSLVFVSRAPRPKLSSIYRTYFTTARGVEALGGIWPLLESAVA
jgi:predicted dithiol-disulfide oxidoreductase (DUF899 family)